MARNAKITIVEAEHIVEPGDIEPGAVHLPGIYATHVMQSDTEKRIEKLPYFKEENPAMEAPGPGDKARKRERIVRRAAKEFQNGMYANLRIGMPMLATSYVDPMIEVQL